MEDESARFYQNPRRLALFEQTVEKEKVPKLPG
jgi:hypothetical protein